MNRSPVLPGTARVGASRLSTGLLLALVLATPPQEIEAQARSLSYNHETRVRFAGSFGAVLSVLPGSSRTSSYALHVSQGQLQTDDGSQSTIVDLENGRIVSLDHDSRTYMTFTLGDMEQALSQATAMAEELRSEWEASLAEAGTDEEELRAELEHAARDAQASFQVQIRSEPGGQSRSFGSVSAQQHFLIVELEPSDELRAEMAAEEEEGGTMVFLMELWQSPELAEMEREIYEGLTMNPQASAEWRSLADQTQELAGVLTPADSYAELALIDPQLGGVALQMQEAAEGMEGTTLDSRFFLVLVPDEVEFDRDAVLAWEPDTMGDVIQGQLTAAARNRAEDAARSAVRGLTRGLLGRGGGGGDAAPPARDPVMHPVARITRTVSDLQLGSPPPSAFQIPDGYREITLEELMQGIGGE